MKPTLFNIQKEKQKLRALKNYAKSTISVLHKWNNKAWITEFLFITWFGLNILNLLFRLTAQEKIPFTILVLFGNASGHPRALIEMYNGLNVDFMPANTKSILQPINQEVTLIFNSQYLGSTFHKAIPAIDCNSSDRTGQN